MNIENPAALHFIMQDEIYFLNKDKNLYRSAPVSVSPVEETPLPVFNYMGGKKNGLLILVHYPMLEFIDEAHLTALENILKRKGIIIGDTAILNMAKHDSADFSTITAYFNPEKLLLLGSNALPAGLPALQLNEPIQLNNCSLLFSYSFDEMMASNELKKAFWDQMKLL